MGIELSGVDDFIKAMQAKAKKLESKEQKKRILMAGAVPIRKAMADKAPVGTGVSNQWDKSNPQHLKDNIVISEMKNDSVDVGPEESFFYAGFQEFGTSHQPAYPFAEPGFLEKKKEAMSEMANETKKVIEGV